MLIGVTIGIFNQFNIAGGCGDEALMIRRFSRCLWIAMLKPEDFFFNHVSI